MGLGFVTWPGSVEGEALGGESRDVWAADQWLGGRMEQAQRRRLVGCLLCVLGKIMLNPSYSIHINTGIW